MGEESQSKKFEELKKALQEDPTPQARKAAAEAWEKYNEERKKNGQHSRPVICSLSRKGEYPTAVPLDRVGEEMAANPKFYNLMKRVIGEKSE